ncbi:hypothetical protein BGY98DRAFT_1045095, partial [Russula aff. rugulosa BPL654]
VLCGFGSLSILIHLFLACQFGYFGSKPRDLSTSWDFSLLRSRGVRVPVPWRLVRNPRVSVHLTAARRKHYLSYVHPFSF